MQKEIEKIIESYSKNKITDILYPSDFNKVAQALATYIESRCKNCKEVKLNIVAKYFKRYNKTVKKNV